jgi:hypothetical protein
MPRVSLTDRDRDRLFSVVGLFVGIASLLVALYPFVRPTLSRLGEALHFGLFLLRCNPFLLLIPPAIAFWIYGWRRRSHLTRFGKRGLALLALVSLINATVSVYLYFTRDYQWLIADGLRREQAGDVSGAVVRLNYAARLNPKFSQVSARRAYNSLLIARALFESYVRQSEHRLNPLATESLCKAFALNSAYRDQVLAIEKLQEELDEIYLKGALSLRQRNGKQFVAALREINRRYENYGYSGSLVAAMGARPERESGLPQITPQLAKRVLSVLRQVPDQRLPETITKLTREFRITGLCEAVSGRRLAR